MSLRLKNALLAVLAAVCLSLPAAIPGLQASALAPAPAPAAAPGQAPTFATGTATVMLDVVVRDKKGRPVLDIQPGEVQVFEEGAPQKIDSFKRVETEPPSVQGRARPTIDRIACPWLVRRFIDRDAEILYVPAAEVSRVARERRATAFDVEGAELGQHGERCRFVAFIARFRLRDPALDRLADVVRAADTGRPELAPERGGFLPSHRGLRRFFPTITKCSRPE